MRVPKQEIPDTDSIAVFARDNLPVHYRLIGVHFAYGSDVRGVIPEDFEIVIEYESELDDDRQGSMEAIQAHHLWADPIVEKIRNEWPPSSVRVTFRERSRIE